MAEEHRYQAPPEGLRLCVNNCGFFGSSATMNLCSKCYRDFCLKEQQQSAIKSSFSAAPVAVTASPSSPPAAAVDSQSFSPPALTLPEAQNPTAAVVVVDDQLPQQPQQQAQANRCLTCRKRVGLTGFKCRCGTTYCGVHRYPEKHACSFDFKKVGREEIARANPLVIAEKLEKI